ncbi:MAG: hypothetical protein DMD89_09855 [Candidatus Rokuibacteriota bacterium]|nr:MAG: hypothetical protein DMD89_09855 [Candidatus Rokubacteria bacterium]
MRGTRKSAHAAPSTSQALKQAQAAPRKANKDASRLDDYVWHSNRHTFASRLAMAGVDLLTIKEIGGPTHLHAAVE